MTSSFRLTPAIFAAFALLGCLLPFGTESSRNLLDYPANIAQFLSVTGPLFAILASNKTAVPSLMVWASRLIYLAPFAAMFVIIINLRGHVPRTLQFAAAVIWLSAVVAVPAFVSDLLNLFFDAAPLLGKYRLTVAHLTGRDNMSSLSFGIGGWLVIFAAISLSLNAFGVIKYRETKSAI